MIATAQAEGDLRADLDPQLVSRLVIGMATWIVEWYQPGGRISATTIADTVVAIALDGAATRPS